MSTSSEPTEGDDCRNEAVSGTKGTADKQSTHTGDIIPTTTSNTNYVERKKAGIGEKPWKCEEMVMVLE